MGMVLANQTGSVAGWQTVLFAILLVGLIACLALEEKLHAKKSIIAGGFAIACLLLGAICDVLPFEKIVVGSHKVVEYEEFSAEFVVHTDDAAEPTKHPVHLDHEDPSEHRMLHVDGHRLEMPVFIPGIDWGVIAIILGSSLFVDVTSKSGLFSWIAIRVTKASAGDPLKLLVFYGVMTVVFSAVLNNVTAMIIVGSLTVVSLERLQRREQLLGFLLVEGLLTNIGGLLTLISSVPNIIVGTAAQISFAEFFWKSSPFVLVATVITIAMGAKMFQIRRLGSAEEQAEARELVSNFDENDGVESWRFFWFGTTMLILFIITIATTSILPLRIRYLGMGFIALAFAGVMLMRYKSEVDKFYKTVDWDLLGFFMALFVVIYVMEHAQVLTAIGDGLQKVVVNINATTATAKDASVLLVGAAVFSSVTDNIPLAAMLANILNSLGAPESSGLWWSVIFGANLGGNLTPIGSASTLVAVTIMHKHQIPMSFGGFVKAALIYAVVQIALALAYVVVFLR
ncbi:MAG: hypothetical protein MK165_04700 [Pirellulaceae bacterium]|nr:hypothetical protein [Pirellulaceae bacterium]